MRLTKQIKFLPAFLFMVACAYAQDIHYNYEHGANFAAYRTYQWVDAPSAPAKPELPGNLPAPPAGLPALLGGLPNLPGGAPDVRSSGSEDQLIDQDIKRAVDEQLAQKGFTKVDKNADVQVSYHAATHNEMNINWSGMASGGRGSGMWDGSAQGQTSNIAIGTLVIDLYDPARKQLIWRGDATKALDIKKDPGKNYKNLEKAVAKLFKYYPPQPNK